MPRMISRAAALRLRLAAGLHPALDVRTLLEALVSGLTLPVTVEKLVNLDGATLARLLSASPGFSGRPLPAGLVGQIRSRLQGAGIVAGPVPETGLCGADEVEEENSWRPIAIASDADAWVDGNFRTCDCFLIYQRHGARYRLMDIRSALESDWQGAARSDQRLRDLGRVGLVQDCSLVVATTLPGPIKAQLARCGIQSLRVPRATPVSPLLGYLQVRLDAGESLAGWGQAPAPGGAVRPGATEFAAELAELETAPAGPWDSYWPDEVPGGLGEGLPRALSARGSAGPTARIIPFPAGGHRHR